MIYNHVAITGILAKEPEFKSTPTGMNYCKFILNVDASYVGKNGEMVSKTNFVPVTLWAKTCEEARNKLTIGSSILVSGSLKQESWKDKDGNPKSTLMINGMNVMYMEDVKPAGKTNTQKIQEAFPSSTIKEATKERVKDGIDLPEDLPF